MSHDVRIAPSILAADPLAIGQALDQIKTADFIHFDVMDGMFVPNLSFGPALLEAIKAATDVPVDVHLMINEPDRRVERYLEAGADVVCFHYEAQTHALRTINNIKEHGALAAIALNPGTPVNVLESLIEDVDMVLIMSVNPGFGGQPFIERTYDKLRRLRALCDERGVDPMVEVDGGVGAGNAEALVRAGANVLVAGSAVCGAPDPEAAIAALRAAAAKGLVNER